MKLGYVLGAIVIALLVAFGIYFVDVDQTQEGELPDVDVSVEGGQLPEADAEVGDIDVGTEEVEVEVPTVDVQSPEEEAAEEGASN